MAGGTTQHGEGRMINGRYRLVRTLGAGGMGRVWLAHDVELACEVAVKEIALPDVPTDGEEIAQRIARARSEARHAARLRGHPHVATVHDVVVHEGLPWIVMEYVPDAVDLQAMTRGSGPLPPDRVARIGLAVLDALMAGHRIGILHRDVKPANILLAPDASGDAYARVLLTDYGIALMPESREPRLTATAGILGTPGYLAPERARGEPPTPAADLFSLGATLYTAVEGRGPFDRNGDYATLTALLGEEPTPAVRAGELAPVLHGLLVKDPTRRSAPETVRHGLERVLQQAAASAPAQVFGPPQGYVGNLSPQPGPSGGVPQGYAVSGPAQGGTPNTPSAPGYGSGGAPAGHVAGGPYGGTPPFTPGAPPAGPGASPATPGGPPYTPGGPPYTPGGPQTPGAPPAPQTPGAPQTPNTPQTPGGPQGPGPYQGWNPYAGSPTVTYAGGGTPPPYPGGPGQSPAGVPESGDTGRRRRPEILVAVVAAVALVIGAGVWGAISLTGNQHKPGPHPTASAPRSPASSAPAPTGPVFVYGKEVGLTKALQAGDCVKAVWTGEPFKSAPNLGVVDCAADTPEGQVVAVDSAADYADARDHGADRCARQSKPLAQSLPDAGYYAVVPTQQGFGAAQGSTACLVLGRHVPIGGEIGRFRDAGVDMSSAQMSVGDCFTYKEDKDTIHTYLTDCGQGHTDQVIGFADAPANMDFTTGTKEHDKLCGNKFQSTWAPGTKRYITGWWPSKEYWNQGFTTMICTLEPADGGKETGQATPAASGSA
ncbi:serine/threonine-protein kinase [Streptomyces sp. NPDC005648]|uniref:serine/threonine-protein kinase n=1 Tax=Streptomyces sp. NPDC005648 TaxID=3157044 RepID=UPI0033B1BFD0